MSLSIKSAHNKRKASGIECAAAAKRSRTMMASSDPGNDPFLHNGTADPEIYATPTNPLACMDGLPDELVINIFKSLSAASLAQLRLTSKRCNSVATECQYEHLDGSRYLSEARSMLSTIADVNPYLSKYVKSIHYGESFREPYEDVESSWARDGEAGGDLTRALRFTTHIQELNISDFMDIKAERSNIAEDHKWIEVFDHAVLDGQ
jgi:hypothetical protein